MFDECNVDFLTLELSLAKPLTLFNVYHMDIIRHSFTAKKHIKKVSTLCKTLDISEGELRFALSLKDNERYIKKEIPKANGSFRTVYNPHKLIRKIQRRINTRIFKQLVIWPSYIFGTIPNTKDSLGRVIERKDYVSCAAKHCKAKSLLKMDISNFFDNIHEYHVNELFINFFHFSQEVSNILSDICCLKGNLIQGALTSSYISCLILEDVEYKVVEKLSRKNLIYTRLVDDISISSKVSNFDFSMVIQLITNMLIEKELPINSAKTKISYLSTEPLMVHGIRINFSEPRFPSDEVKKLRSNVHNLKILASQPYYRTTHSYRTDFSQCMGRVNKLKRVKHPKHQQLVNKLNKIKPLPSEKDLKRCRSMLHRLMLEHTYKSNSISYKNRFYRLHDRLNVLQRTSKYKPIARIIRSHLKNLTPKKG